MISGGSHASRQLVWRLGVASVVCVCLTTTVLAEDKNKAMYVGGMAGGGKASWKREIESCTHRAPFELPVM